MVHDMCTMNVEEKVNTFFIIAQKFEKCLPLSLQTVFSSPLYCGLPRRIIKDLTCRPLTRT